LDWGIGVSPVAMTIETDFDTLEYIFSARAVTATVRICVLDWLTEPLLYS